MFLFIDIFCAAAATHIEYPAVVNNFRLESKWVDSRKRIPRHRQWLPDTSSHSHTVGKLSLLTLATFLLWCKGPELPISTDTTHRWLKILNYSVGNACVSDTLAVRVHVRDQPTYGGTNDSECA